MLALIGPWLAKSALMSSPIGGLLGGFWALLKKIPRQVWYVLIALALVFVGYKWVEHKIHAAYAQGSKAGHADQFAHDQAQLDKIRAQAREYKRKLDTANNKIQTEEKARHDQTVANNRALADALRLRIRTAPQPGGRGGANLPGATTAGLPAGGSQAPADAGLGQGADRPLLCVDANGLIDYAEQADNDHDALVRQEDAQKRYLEHWPASTAPPK